MSTIPNSSCIPENIIITVEATANQAHATQ